MVQQRKGAGKATNMHAVQGGMWSAVVEVHGAAVVEGKPMQTHSEAVWGEMYGA